MESPSPSPTSTSHSRNNRESHRSHRRRRVLTTKSLSESCPICLCQVEESRQAAVIIPCNHVYCIECIRKWSNFNRKCPLCNSEFDSWFININPSSRTFQKEKLSPAAPAKGTSVTSSDTYIRRRRHRDVPQQFRLHRRFREEFSSSSSRTRPLPWRRSFSRGQDEHPDVVAERVLRWRSSLYEQHFQAVPISSQSCLLQQIATSNDAKKLVLQRIEPWIKRELHAVLGDPDPSIIVHVASSLFISLHERKNEGPTEQLDVGHDFLSSLQPFLHDRTEMFWHELRCFAECSYSMETYDSIVEYTRLSE